MQKNHITYKSYMTLLHINSKYRSSGSIDNFVYSFNPPPKINEVKLLEVHIPLSMYVINSSNNVITFIESSTPLVTRQAILTPGNYSSLNITTEIKSKMDAAGNQSYTVTFDDVPNTITISAASAFQIKFTASKNPAERLGFDIGDTVMATSQKGSYPINLSPSGVYFLAISGLGLTNVITSHLQPSPGNYPICLIGNSDDLARWQNDDIYPAIKATSISGNINVKLLNADGSPAGLNRDWSVTLLLC